MSGKVLYGALAAGVIGVGAVVALGLSSDLRLIEVGIDAPSFEARDARTQDQVSLANYEGKVVLLNVWATWCAPCRIEMPSMQRLYDQFKDEGFRIAAISVDVGRADKVLEFADEFNLTFEILHDPAGHINQAYQITGYPESFLIDRQGTIVKKIIGPHEWDSPSNVALVSRLLSDTP